jgi:hypothetical protein
MTTSAETLVEVQTETGKQQIPLMKIRRLHRVAIIDKNASAQIRVIISTWRGQHRLEIREFSPGPISGSWWSHGNGISIDIAKLDELIEGLRKAETEAVTRGLIKGRGP